MNRWLTLPAPALRCLIPALIAIAWPDQASAQSTVGEALAQGGLVVSGDVLAATISGGWTGADESNGIVWEQTYDLDGRYRGWSRNVLSPIIAMQTFRGTWWIDGAGRLCLKLEANPGRSVCRWYLKVGDQWFATGGTRTSLVEDVPSGAQPTPETPLLKRKVWR